MNHAPRISIRTRFDASAKDCWVWVIKRASPDTFEMSFDDSTFTYDIKDLVEIVSLIATDHVRRHRGGEHVIIESNLGFTPFETKGRDLQKHLQHTLKLFQSVINIDYPPKITNDYADTVMVRDDFM